MTTRRAARHRDEDGVGLVALPWGVLAFGAFLMLSVQVAVHLFSTSIVTATGHEATRRAALGGGSPEAIAEAEQWLRSRFGSSMEVESVRWITTADVVALEITARPPNLLPGAAALSGLGSIERRFEMRRELARFDAGG
ncbi:hypothetical protein [Candidatus Poriferisodalis sp.]|uniref:hypothetical protein n=1 Tax=Candidatus Poriferisodalis sp. TaxID=3101277 RepID=UPI003B01C09B